MEGDSEIVINSLQNGDMFHYTFGHLVKITMFYVNSLHNSITDALAKRAMFSSLLSV